MQKFDNQDVEAEVIELLKKTSIPVSTDYVAHHIGMGWGTARSVLLNMALKGEIQSEKTTKSLIFKLPKKESSK